MVQITGFGNGLKNAVKDPDHQKIKIKKNEKKKKDPDHLLKLFFEPQRNLQNE